MKDIDARQRFRSDMTVDDALAFHPAARWVFASYHLAGCRDCERSACETLREVAETYGFEIERFLRDLNSLLDS